MTYAYEYIVKNKLALEDDYPYKAVDQTCKRKKKGKRFTVPSYKALEGATVKTLSEEILNQPISVAIEVQYDF